MRLSREKLKGLKRSARRGRKHARTKKEQARKVRHQIERESRRRNRS